MANPIIHHESDRPYLDLVVTSSQPGIRIRNEGGGNAISVVANDGTESALGGGSSGVSSFNGRTGVVVPQAADYATLYQPTHNVVMPVPGFTVWNQAPGALNAAGHCYGSRCIVPKSGTLHDLAIVVGTASGNIEVGVLDTTATTRNRLYTTGTIACPTGTGWHIVGDPALSVTAGDHLDLYMSVDNVTATFSRHSSLGTTGEATLPANFLVSPLGGSPIIMWDFTGGSIGTTTAETNLTNFGGTVAPIIIARIA